jgi:hypothetical protein
MVTKVLLTERERACKRTCDLTAAPSAAGSQLTLEEGYALATYDYRLIEDLPERS